MAEKNKGGRPSKYNDLDLKKVKQLAERGWTDAEMAQFFEVDYATWKRWKGRHEKFCAALKEWKVYADNRVERSLFERAVGYDHPEDKIFCTDGQVTIVPTMKHEPPNVTAQIFWLKNRQPDNWRDKHDVDLNAGVTIKWDKKLEGI